MVTAKNSIIEWNDIEKDKREIIERHLNKVNELLQEIENIIKDDLKINTPVENLAVPIGFRISIPHKYIRKTQYFEEKYNLNGLIPSKALRKNIEYALQLTDFFNYIFSRFEIAKEGLSVGAFFRKIAIIHAVSIIEAVWFGYFEKFIHWCHEVNCIERCALPFEKSVKKIIQDILKNRKDSTFFHLSHVKEFVNIGIQMEKNKEQKDILADYKENLEALRNFRNRIHLYYKDENGNLIQDFIEEDYSIDKYNNTIITLEKTPCIIKKVDDILKSYCCAESG